MNYGNDPVSWISFLGADQMMSRHSGTKGENFGPSEIHHSLVFQPCDTIAIPIGTGCGSAQFQFFA